MVNPEFLEKENMLKIICPLPSPVQKISYHLNYLKKFLDEEEKTAIENGGKFELNPDFQRGHIWSVGQQIHFIENLLKGIAELKIIFNCPTWNAISNVDTTDINQFDFVCLDGLQRITAVLDFIDMKFKIFNNTYSHEDLKGTYFDLKKYKFNIEMYNFDNKRDMIKFYIDYNTGGTPHSESEILRVKKMLEDL